MRKPLHDAPRNLVAGMALALALLAVPGAHAAINCTVSTPGINFGVYDPSSTGPDDVAGNLAVTCTRVIFVDVFHVPFTVALQKGSNSSYNPRTLRSGANVLNYNIYRDAAHSQVWGDGSSSTVTLSGSSDFVWFQTSQTDNYTMYGRVPALQDVRTGSYSDNIVLQITF